MCGDCASLSPPAAWNNARPGVLASGWNQGATMPTNKGVLPPVAFRILCVLVTAGAMTTANASFHTFQVDELYTNADGTVQFIELHEAFNADNEQFLSGHIITVKQGPTTHSFTLPNDLPSANTAGKHVLIATPGFAQLGIVTPDYIV